MKSDTSGFTLVELIIVIAVIGVLAAILIPVFFNVVHKANNAAIIRESRDIYTHFETDIVPEGEMPDTGWIAVSYNGKTYYVEITEGQIQQPDILTEDRAGKNIIAWNDHTEHVFINGVCFCGAVSEDAFIHTDISDFRYTVNYNNTVTLNEYIGNGGAVTVPDAYIIDGKAYRPILDSETVFHDKTSVTSVKLYGAGFAENSMKSLFYNCTGLTSVDFTNSDTSGVVSIRSMLYGCTGLTNVDFTGLNTANVKNMRSVFSGCSALHTADLSMLDTGNNTTLELLFYNCSSLTSVNLSGMDTSHVESIRSMFRGCSKLKSADLSSFNTISVTDMACLFYECPKLTNVNVSSFNTSSVTDMRWMFYGCTSLAAVDVSGFDTGKVTSMKSMFCDCKKLSGLTGYENWDTHSLTEMNFMFNNVGNASGAGEVTKIDLSSWDLSNMVNNGWCFQNCRAKQILLPDSLAVISAGFLNHANKVTGSAYTIPKGVRKIGYAHTIYDFATNDFTEFIVAEGNTHYKTIDGILYSADGTEMLAVPRAKPFENGVFELPEGVTFLGELSFSRNQNIETLVLPDSYEISYVELYDPRYVIVDDTGNLNDGNSLKIAIYLYCNNLTKYVVKDTNPRYSSREGIIYSKDMKRLIEIPTRYVGQINVPEGVERWEKRAYLFASETDAEIQSLAKTAMSGCTGVSLPSTLSFMDEYDFRLLNIMHDQRKGTENPFTITVAEDNTLFYVDANGNLCKR